MLSFVRSPSFPSRVRLLLYLDAFDSALVGDAAKVQEDFDKYDAELLLCPSKESSSPMPAER